MDPVEKSPIATRHLYLVLIVGVPGIGKSYLIGRLKSFIQSLPDHFVTVCTSDEIRSKTLSQYYADNNIRLDELSQQDIYKIEELNVPNTRAALMKDIQAKLEAASSSNAIHNVFILDKNHSSKTLIAHVEDTANALFGEQRIHRVVLVPDTFGSNADKICKPFDFDILLIGLIRSLCRKEHMTMKFGSVHSLLSFVGCLQGQIKEPFSDRFPEERFSQAPVHYYDSEVLRKGKAEPENRKAYDELHDLICEVTAKQRTVAESADRIVELVTKLKPLSEFPVINQDVLKELYENIHSSK
jgi:hypothetical protein